MLYAKVDWREKLICLLTYLKNFHLKLKSVKQCYLEVNYFLLKVLQVEYFSSTYRTWGNARKQVHNRLIINYSRSVCCLTVSSQQSPRVWDMSYEVSSELGHIL